MNKWTAPWVRKPAGERMRDALDHMIQLIMLGWEFVDAAWYVSNVYGIDQTMLEIAYDERP